MSILDVAVKLRLELTREKYIVKFHLKFIRLELPVHILNFFFVFDLSKSNWSWTISGEFINEYY